jgi:hypothetical protein
MNQIDLTITNNYFNMIIEESHWSFPNQNKSALSIDVHGRTAYLLKDGQGNNHFAIETSYSSFSAISTDGLYVVYNEIDMDARNNIPVIQFKCAHPAFMSLFVRIINETISKSSGNDFENTARSIINIWMRFLNKSRKARMDDNLVIGLIGELLFIQRLITLNVEKSLILDCWTGPDQESKDFTFDSTFIEVKSSSKSSGHVHGINGIDQLNADNRLLYLNSFHFNKTSGSSGLTLNKIVTELNDQHFSPAGLELIFFDKLYDYGFDKRDQDYYENIRIEIIGDKLLKVDDSFPKITMNEFKIDIDSRISNLKYDVDLNSLNALNYTVLKNVLH